MAATVYVTPVQLREIVGADALGVAAPDGAGGADEGKISAAIADVASEIDSAVSIRYETPLDAVPDFLRRAAARIVHYELCDPSSVTELVAERAKAARAMVRDVAAGRKIIGAATVRDGSSGAAELDAPNERAFTRSKTAGLI